jgi:hypothetical protein
MPRYETDPKREPTSSEKYQFVYEAGFSGLGQPPEWWVIGNGNPLYKCVAWTLGVKHELGPVEDADTFPVARVDEFYDQFGYEKKANVPGGSFKLYDVLAYGPNMNEVAHVAVYLDVEGVGPTWTSKMGTAQLITHSWTQLLAPKGAYGNVWPAYYTHNGTMPELPLVEGQTFEQTVQRLLRESGLDRL